MTSIHHDDAGLYTCVAINSLGSDSWKTNITVVEYPEVLVTPVYLSVSVGQNAEFHCEAHGLPTPRVRWAIRTRGTRSQGSPYQWTAIQDSGHSLLTLSDVSEEDSGNILCSASNPGGSSNFTARLQVRVSPRFSSLMLPMSVLGDWPALLPWRIHAVPNANISFYKGGQLVSHRFNVTKQGIYFTPIYPSDSALYTIRAENSEGDLMGAARVTVIKNYPRPTLVRGQHHNVTLSFPGVPSTLDGVVYEVWVVVFEGNMTYTDYYTSPLDLRYDTTSPNTSYITAVYDRLPETVIVGDEKSYTSDNMRMTVMNTPLSGNMWYAICLRVMEPGTDLEQPPSPLGATHYLFTFTENIGASIEDSVPGWQVALAVLGGLILAAILALNIYCLWRCRDRDNMEAFVKTLKVKGTRQPSKGHDG
jgi:hypothetical protein